MATSATRSRGSSVVTLALVYLAAAVVLTWPLAAGLTTTLGALQGPGDPYLNLWSLGWGLHAWTTDPLSVVTGGVFDANIFFPAAGTLTYSDHLLLQSFVLAPVYLVTGNAVLCYNLLLILSLAASGLAAHALVRALTGSMWGALVAGLAWACWPYRTAHLVHIQLQALYFLPLAWLFLHRLAAGRRRRDAVWLGVVAALQAISSVYYGVMTMIALGAGAIVLAVQTGQWRSRRLWARLTMAAVLGAVLVLPVAVPYLQSQQREGFGRNLFEAANHSASAQSYTQVPPDNLLYGATGLLAPRAPEPGARDRRSVEHQMFPGLTVVVLAVIGLWAGWRSSARPAVAAAAALVVIGAVLSAGPEGARGLYAALFDNVFGFGAIRAPARFAVVAMLGLVVLAGFGMRRAIAAVDSTRAPRVALIVLALLMAEYVNRPLPLVAAPPLHTSIGAWLGQEPTPGAVLHLPLGVDIDNTPAMVQSLEHWRPLVNGYSGQRPSFFTALVDSLAGLPSPGALQTLDELDVRFVVSPRPLAGAGDPRVPLVERARFAEGVIYEVRWTPASEAALGEAAVADPPPPAVVPFRAGEIATYEVRWDGGPIDLPAGTATVRVEAPAGYPGGDRPDAAWAFEATAETADWVTTFFEARDVFTTVADRMLRPLEHTRAIREGGRSLDRTYLYDPGQGLVHVGESREAAQQPGSLALPMPASARDALTAYFYVRTQPLEPGTDLTVPLNEAGRNLVLHVAAGRSETIDWQGQQVRARRLEPRLTRRLQRRQPLQMTLWLSDDERRVPLRVIVEAGFGRVHAELVDYTR